MRKEFEAHSMHCTFVFGGSAMGTIHYHVERVRDGITFSTRAVRAVQNTRTIFLGTISFVRPLPESITKISHAEPKPPKVPIPPATGADLKGNTKPNGKPIYESKRWNVTFPVYRSM